MEKDFKLSIADVETMFDGIGGEIFVKPYVPRVKSSNRVVSNKRNKKLKLFNRVISGEFSFHYDTDQLERNMHMFKPDDDISISVKLHGTSAIIGNVKTLKPKWSRLIIDVDNINTNYTSIEIEKMRIPMHKKYGDFLVF